MLCGVECVPNAHWGEVKEKEGGQEGHIKFIFRVHEDIGTLDFGVCNFILTYELVFEKCNDQGRI